MKIGDIVISSDRCILIDRILTNYDKTKTIYGNMLNPETFEKRENRIRLNSSNINLIWNPEKKEWVNFI